MATQYSQKMPDMSRNTALAGKTVYSNGMNVTYNDQGYATHAVNPNHKNYEGTTKSIHAQPIEDALAGKSWTEPSHDGLIEWGDGTGMGRVSGGGSSSGWGFSSGGGGQVSRNSANAYADQLAALYGSDGYYAQQLAQMQAAREAATRAAVAKLNSQKTDINNQYNDMYRQAYIDKMQGLKNINQSLAAQGVTGGATESTMLGLNTSYADALRKAEQERIGTIGDLDQAIIQTQATGDADVAQLAFDSAKERTDKYADVLRQLMSREDSLAAQLAAQNASEQSSQQAWARQLATQLLAQGNMPDDETLSAAGISRSQADMLLAQPESSAVSGEYMPGFSRAQVMDAYNRALANGQTLTGNLLRDYNFYLYNDPDYSPAGSAAYSAAPASVPASASSSTPKKASYNNGSYSNAEIKALQQWLQANGYGNLAADGYWGPASQSTTGMSANDAMAWMQAQLAASNSKTTTGSLPAGLEDVNSFASAKAYMQRAGVDNTTLLGLMNSADWNNRKKYGSSNSAVTNYNTYEEYVRAYCEYAVTQ